MPSHKNPYKIFQNLEKIIANLPALILPIMLSTLARRSLMVTARRAPAVAMSTKSHMMVASLEKNLEDLFEALHWHDKADDVKEIDHLMNEFKTNHAVGEPDTSLDFQVEEKLMQINEMLRDKKPNHTAIDHSLLDLKVFLKHKMYDQAA